AGATLKRSLGVPPGPSSDGSLAVSRLESLEQQIAKLTSTVETLVDKGFDSRGVPQAWTAVHRQLVDSGVEDALAREVTQELAQSSLEPERVFAEERLLVDSIAKSIRAEGGVRLPEDGQKVVVLIGPTGVGKTTTLAKIAAGFLQQGRRVAFVTADTYRLAAVDQLQKYADIMGLCLETVYSPEEMARAIGRHSDKEMVFVDTAGRSQRDPGQMEEVQAFVAACQPAEVHLLLSATTKREDLEEILERFSICAIDRLILTKVDESTCFGPLYSVVRKSPIPFSYITTGQNVPEDIEEATSEKIAKLICRGTLGCATDDALSSTEFTLSGVEGLRTGVGDQDA
ncbi:MAG TPA: hypothetical protein ENN74_03390, partial [Firmicutes bacterium]|nr:hypothetical protein [Bacillota bacterium]